MIVAICFEMTLFDASIIIIERFFLFNNDEFKKTLRRKKLTHFSLLYLKILEFSKFDDMK